MNPKLLSHQLLNSFLKEESVSLIKTLLNKLKLLGTLLKFSLKEKVNLQIMYLERNLKNIRDVCLLK